MDNFYFLIPGWYRVREDDYSAKCYLNAVTKQGALRLDAKSANSTWRVLYARNA
jgi:hypothetical protein